MDSSARLRAPGADRPADTPAGSADPAAPTRTGADPTGPAPSTEHTAAVHRTDPTGPAPPTEHTAAVHRTDPTGPAPPTEHTLTGPTGPTGAASTGWRRALAAVQHSVGAGAAADGPAPGPRWIVRGWLVSRVLTFLILIPENNILGDVRYYGRQLEALFGPTPVTAVLREYPAPALAVFVPPWWAALSNKVAYLVTFVLLMVAIDIAFTAGLWRASGRRPTPGVRVWLVLVPCLGPLTFTRFDLVSAALAGAALLALAARRPLGAGPNSASSCRA